MKIKKIVGGKFQIIGLMKKVITKVVFASENNISENEFDIMLMKIIIIN